MQAGQRLAAQRGRPQVAPEVRRQVGVGLVLVVGAEGVVHALDAGQQTLTLAEIVAGCIRG